MKFLNYIGNLNRDIHRGMVTIIIIVTFNISSHGKSIVSVDVGKLEIGPDRIFTISYHSSE